MRRQNTLRLKLRSAYGRSKKAHTVNGKMGHTLDTKQAESSLIPDCRTMREGLSRWRKRVPAVNLNESKQSTNVLHAVPEDFPNRQTTLVGLLIANNMPTWPRTWQLGIPRIAIAYLRSSVCGHVSERIP